MQKHNTNSNNWSSKLKNHFLINLSIIVFCSHIFVVKIITMFDQIKLTHLYQTLMTLPKAVMHHNHFICCDDQQFFVQCVVNDPIVYLKPGFDGFQIGTTQEAKQNKWITMEEGRNRFEGDERKFIKAVSNITMLNSQDMHKFINNMDECWSIFQQKILKILPLLGVLHIFKKYVKHVLKKYAQNGYIRLQFRGSISPLKEYDKTGNLIKTLPPQKYMQVFDEVHNEVKKDYPTLTVGFIFFGMKMFDDSVNQKNLSFAFEQKWDKAVGIDFVQEEDIFGSLQKYDKIANKVLEKFEDQKIQKVYHCGETCNNLNNNIQIAIKAGTARIGHGINVIQHPHLLQICRNKQICFQINPISNLVLGYCSDPRMGIAPLLLGLGIPVSISPDDPGKFGYEDTTMDYFICSVSYNWTLKHLKLIAYHSINHSLCSSQQKDNMMMEFNCQWEKWIQKFVQ